MLRYPIGSNGDEAQFPDGGKFEEHLSVKIYRIDRYKIAFLSGERKISIVKRGKKLEN